MSYDEGYNAYFRGLDLADNPYPFDTREGRSWSNGWLDAETEDEAEEDDFFGIYDTPDY